MDNNQFPEMLHDNNRMFYLFLFFFFFNQNRMFYLELYIYIYIYYITHQRDFNNPFI